jgi:hypothetical protein
VTVLLDGGEIPREDVAHSVRAGRRVLVIAGSGRTADQLAAAVLHGVSFGPDEKLVKSGLLDVINMADGALTLANNLRSMLTTASGS